MWWGSMKERVRQRKRECLGGKDRKRNERADLSLHLGKQPPSAPWPTLLFPLSDTAVIYCSSRLIKQAFYVLRDEGGGFWKGEGCGNSRLNGEPSEDVNRRPWRHLPGPGSMALFSRLYWGSDVFGFHVLHPFSPSSFSSALCCCSFWFLVCWRTPAVNLWFLHGESGLPNGKWLLMWFGWILLLFLTSLIWSQSPVAEVIWISVANAKQVDETTEKVFICNAFLNKASFNY